MLSDIEADRTEWVERREVIQSLKTRLTKIEEEIVDARAELVATAGLLDENDKLRETIQAEERLKAQQVIEKEREEVREEVREQMMKEVEKERELRGNSFSAEIAELNATINDLQARLHQKEDSLSQLQQYSSGLEQRLADTEVNVEGLQERVQELEKEAAEREEQHAAKIEAVADEADDAIALLEDRQKEAQYKMFAGLMNTFEAERAEWDERYRQLQSLLAEAAKDIGYLLEENVSLKSELESALFYEPPIKPLAPRLPREREKENEKGEEKEVVE
jgi:chromosome segregation ATPase